MSFVPWLDDSVMRRALLPFTKEGGWVRTPKRLRNENLVMLEEKTDSAVFTVQGIQNKKKKGYFHY